jgi:hypothetical protein
LDIIRSSPNPLPLVNHPLKLLHPSLFTPHTYFSPVSIPLTKELFEDKALTPPPAGDCDGEAGILSHTFIDADDGILPDISSRNSQRREKKRRDQRRY